LALAVVSYWGLSALAAAAAAPTTSGVPTVNLLAAIAGGLRWVLPLLFLAGVVASLVARAKRSSLINAAHARGSASVAGMNWQEFELLIGEAFRQRGYRVEERGGSGADGGIDLVLKRDGQKTLVQCKHWKVYKVGVSVVRELYGVMTATGAARGIVVTSGRFTDDAAAFAKQTSIDLLDGAALAALIEEGRASKVAGRAGAAASPAPASASTDTSAEASPDCPACGAPMTQRVAKRGANEGRAFWGCSTYPRCRGTRAL
jgi:restriction system protein